MKNILTFLFFVSAITANAQEKPKTETAKQTQQVVEASCGQCNFGMKGGGCTLAVRIDGKPYFVDGTSIDKHGDAHAADGFCSAIRKAEVTGAVVDGRFKASSFRLLGQKTEPKP